MKNRKYYISQGNALIEVSREIRNGMNREVNYLIYRKRRHKACMANLYTARKCEGECNWCEYHLFRDASLEESDEQCNTQIVDRYGEQEFRVVEITADVARIDKDGEIICRMILLKYSPSEIAAYLGISRDTYYHRLRNIARLLRWDE